MSIFKKLLEMMAGRTISERNAVRGTTGAASARDLVDIARRTLLSTRKPIKLQPPGRRLTAITTEDIDPNTGKLFPDYLARREARQRKENEPKLIYSIGDDD